MFAHICLYIFERQHNNSIEKLLVPTIPSRALLKKGKKRQLHPNYHLSSDSGTERGWGMKTVVSNLLPWPEVANLTTLSQVCHWISPGYLTQKTPWYIRVNRDPHQQCHAHIYGFIIQTNIDCFEIPEHWVERQHKNNTKKKLFMPTISLKPQILKRKERKP